VEILWWSAVSTFKVCKKYYLFPMLLILKLANLLTEWNFLRVPISSAKFQPAKLIRTK
jgi:hypothetical protein